MLSRIILGALALFLAVSLVLTDRPWTLASMPRVDEVDTLPAAPDMAAMRYITEIGATLPYPARRTPPPADAAPPPLKLGWAYREVSLFGLPLWGYPEPGLVTYLEGPREMRVAILAPEQLAAIDGLAGKRYSALGFPWYKFVWGWLLVVGIFAWTWARTREVRRAEESYFEEAPEPGAEPRSA